MKDDFIGQTFPTPKGGVMTVVGVVGKSKNGIKIYSSTCSICSEDKELFPDLFESQKGNLVNGQVPCGCSKQPKWRPFQATIITRRLCVDAGYEFIGFPDGYRNQRSKFSYNCPVHGKQTVTYHSFVNNGTRCPSCSGNKKKTLEEAENIVKELCDVEGYEYIGFPEGYKNAFSKFSYNCPTHGKQTVSYDNFVNKGNRCPSCANHGYDQSKPGYFYLFKYEKKDQDQIPVYKFGITNRLVKIRSKEHIAGIKGVKSKMIYEWYFDDGSIPKIMEIYIKENYETGISNWLTSGNTETVSANDDSFEVEAGNILMMSQMM